MLLSDIINLFILNSNVNLPKPNDHITRLIQIHFKSSINQTKNKTIVEYDNFGGYLQISQKQIKKISNYLTSKNYTQQTKSVKCYVYNNKKMYVHDINNTTINYKEEEIYDFQYGDDYLMIILDEKEIKSSQFPIVNNYHNITNYIEKYYILNNEISVIFKEYDPVNTHMCIQIRVFDEIKASLTRLLDVHKFKQINNLLDMVSQTDIKCKALTTLNRK